MSGNFDSNREKIKRVLESEPVPEELSPESIKRLLDEKASAKKKKNIKKTSFRIAAGTAACAVICGFGVHYAKQEKVSYNQTEEDYSQTLEATEIANSEEISVMNSISDYGELYRMLENASEDYENSEDYWEEKSADIMEDTDETDYSDAATGAEESQYLETYNQEEGVLEADIVKIDGEFIYYLYSGYTYDDADDSYISYVRLNVAQTENGSFTDYYTVDIGSTIDEDYNSGIYTDNFQMYLYNGMIIVIGSMESYYIEESDLSGYDVVNMDSKVGTFVNIYTSGINPQLVDSYYQDGAYNDVRITADGYMYLITNYSSRIFDCIEDEYEVSAYVPSYTVSDEDCYISPEDIMIS